MIEKYQKGESMTQQEIRELRINAEAMSLMETLCDDVRDVAKKYVSALERLEKLEAAVAWHGWDELPDQRAGWHCGLEFVDCDGEVYEGGFNHDTGRFTSQKVTEIASFNKWMEWDHCDEYDAEVMMRAGFTGWRYPVGDLSEKIKLKVQSKQNAVEAQLEDDLISGRIPFLSGEGMVPGSLRIAKGDNQ